jgi:ABC-type transporter Mla maintaining outer membrane lipid asymmetry ATPase subunit MlaF
MGYVFQGAALFDSLTVVENVAYPLREHTSLGEAEIRERVVHSLSMVGLTPEVLALLPSELSGGMRKRVGSRARSSASRRCCCSTSRPPAWTRPTPAWWPS